MDKLARAKKIMALLHKHYAPVRGDLNYANNYQLTIAVVLSAQTTDVQVNRVTGTLFSYYPDFSSLGKAALPEVEEIIRATGFYHQKAKNIIALSKMVTEEWQGTLPREMEKLTLLPGVGRKSANIIRAFGFGIPAFAVDTHVKRISRRLGFTVETDPDRVEKDVTSLLPESLWSEGHLLLIRHGRATCKARAPLCNECPVSDYCESEDKTITPS